MRTNLSTSQRMQRKKMSVMKIMREWLIDTEDKNEV